MNHFFTWLLRRLSTVRRLEREAYGRGLRDASGFIMREEEEDKIVLECVGGLSEDYYDSMVDTHVIFIGGESVTCVIEKLLWEYARFHGMPPLSSPIKSPLVGRKVRLTLEILEEGMSDD